MTARILGTIAVFLRRVKVGEGGPCAVISFRGGRKAVRVCYVEYEN